MYLKCVCVCVFAGASVLLGRRIAAELANRLSSPWTPHFTKTNGTAWSGSNFWREVRALPPSLRPSVPPSFFLSLSLSLSHTHTHTHVRYLVQLARLYVVLPSLPVTIGQPWDTLLPRLRRTSAQRHHKSQSPSPKGLAIAHPISVYPDLWTLTFDPAPPHRGEAVL